jgi:hypothetical protein
MTSRLSSLPILGLACVAVLLGCAAAQAAPFSFSTGSPDGRIGLASRPDLASPEIESADDFILQTATNLTGGSFTGLLPLGLTAADISFVAVEIYRVFPKDSTDPPSGNVPTRVNSPSDVAFEERNTADASLSFTTSVLADTFTASNSILNGINPSPLQTTGGEGPVTGQEVQFNLTFLTPFDLPADHYFFVPQVQLTSGDFFWLSAAGPVPPLFAGDLQAWIRNQALEPDWLRAGSDIVGPNVAEGPRFNETFSLQGDTVPEPATLVLLGSGLLLMSRARRRRTP